MKRPPDNGSGKIMIDQVDMGGWLRVFPRAGSEESDSLAIYLSHSLAEWSRANAHLRVRFVVPISKEGRTVELHAWYDVHVLPSSSASAKPNE